MKAIIYENGTKYASHVLAIKKAGWRTEVLVFNQERTRIRRVKMWKPERRVFIVDSGNFDCKARGWEGYADVLEDDALQKAVRFGKTAVLSGKLRGRLLRTDGSGNLMPSFTVSNIMTGNAVCTAPPAGQMLSGMRFSRMTVFCRRRMR